MKSSTALSLNFAPAASTRPGLSVTALDLSLSATGWAKSDGTSGVIATGEKRGMARVAYILDCVDEITRGADLTVIEGYAFGAKGRAVFDIAEMGGVVRFTLYEWSRRTVEVPPANLKMFATGSGNANKMAVVAAAIRNLCYQGSNDNEADALFLLEMAKAHYGTRTNAARLTAKQTQSLSKIQWPALTPVNSAARRDISHTEE